MTRAIPRTILLAFALIGLGSTLANAQSSASDIYKKNSPTTVFIKTDAAGGSGFLASSSGIVVTALHVLDGASRVAVKTSAGDIYDQVSVVAKDARRDIAILKIPGFNLPSVELGNSDSLVPGDRLTVLGNPLALDELRNSVSDGILSGVRDLGEGFKLLQMTAPVSAGNSGGPVFSPDGKVVGVVLFKLVKGESLNFAIPINYVRGLLDSVDLTKPLATFDASKTGPDLFANKPAKDISGTWKAPDGQILQIRDRGAHLAVLNLTYPQVSTDAQWIDDYVLGVIYNGGLFGDKWYLMRLSASGRLYFWFFDYKPKEPADLKLKRAKTTMAKNPDFVLMKVD